MFLKKLKKSWKQLCSIDIISFRSVNKIDEELNKVNKEINKVDKESNKNKTLLEILFAAKNSNNLKRT